MWGMLQAVAHGHLKVVQPVLEGTGSQDRSLAAWLPGCADVQAPEAAVIRKQVLHMPPVTPMIPVAVQHASHAER